MKTVRIKSVPVTVCDEMRNGDILLINGKLEKVVRLITIQGFDKRIYDTVILLDKKKNRYFSWNRFVEKTSWVKTIEKVDSIKQTKQERGGRE